MGLWIPIENRINENLIHAVEMQEQETDLVLRHQTCCSKSGKGSEAANQKAKNILFQVEN